MSHFCFIVINLVNPILENRICVLLVKSIQQRDNPYGALTVLACKDIIILACKLHQRYVNNMNYYPEAEAIIPRGHFFTFGITRFSIIQGGFSF